MVGLDKPLARIWVSSLTCGSAQQAFCPNVKLKAWHGGARQNFGRNWVSSLTCGSAKQAFCPNVRLKAWHGGYRQTFGPNLGFKIDMRERKTSVLLNVRLKAWHGGAIDKPLARVWVSSLTCGSAKQAFCPNVSL